MGSSGKTLGLVEMAVAVVMMIDSGGTSSTMFADGAMLFFSGAMTELSLLMMPNPATSGQDGIIRSSVANAQIVYGTIQTGGVLTFANSYGSNGSNSNAFLTCCIAHSLTRQNSAGTAGMPVEGVQGYYVNDVYVPLVVGGSGGWNQGRGYASGTGACSIKQNVPDVGYNDLAGNLWISFSDGSQTTMDPIYSYFGAVVNSEFIGLGNSYSTFVYFMSADQGTFTGAFPNGLNTPSTCRVVLSGQKLYDPRLDSDNGGSGTQRLTDTNGWTFSSNPALILADYLTRSRSDGGCGYNPGTYSGSTVINSQINWASIAAAANICDENVSVPAYGAVWNGSTWTSTDTVARYSFNGAIDTQKNCDANVADILKTMCGYIVVAGNQIYVNAGATTTPESTVIDETFLAGPVSFAPTVQRSQTYNAVKITYGQEPQQDWNQGQGMPMINSTFELEDGGVRLWFNDTISACNNQYQCQIIERILSNKSRNKQVLRLKTNLKGLIFKAGDVVNINLSELGLSNAPFKIMQYSLNSNYTISMTLLQENANTYVLPGTPDGIYQPYNISNFQTLYQNTPSGPGAPTSMTASPLFSGILLQWTPPSPNQYNFQSIYRGTAATPLSSYTEIAAHVVGDSFVDTETTASQKYWYYITATNYWNISSATPSSAMCNAVALTTINETPGTIHDCNIPDAMFQTGSGSMTPPGWEQNTGNVTTFNYFTSAVYTGSQCLEMYSTVTGNQGIQTIQRYAVMPGDQVSYGAVVKSYNGDTITMGISFYKGSTFLSDDFVSTTSGSWDILSATSTAPAGASSFSVWVQFNSTVIGHLMFVNQVWASINDPSIAGSGVTTGDARNVSNVTSANVQYYCFGLTITSPNPNEITTTAFTLLMGGPGTGNVSYNASSISGLTASTTYYLWFQDGPPSFQGGSLTLNASTNKYLGTCDSSPYNIYLGYWTTPASGGGGGGGIGGCLHPDTIVETVDGFKRAADIIPTDSLYAPDGYEIAILDIAKETEENWLDIETENGIARVTCTQPFRMIDGTWKRAHALMLHDKLAHGLHVLSIKEHSEVRDKIMINVGEPHSYMLTIAGPELHNAGGKP